ncbi:CAP domain-containing protein [Chloroflexota bacterium]
MKKKIIIPTVLLVMALSIVPSCAPSVSQEEYDRMSNELSAMQDQITSLQGKLAEAQLLQIQNQELNKQFDAVKGEAETAQAKYEELNAEYEELDKQFEAVKGEAETMQVKYEELNIEYEELDKQFEELTEQYNIIIEGVEINEEDVEQAIFKLINQERINNGLNELLWGEKIYKWAIENSRNMAANKRLEYSENIGWQEVFWGTGYSTIDRMANAALTTWQNKQQYERNFLSTGAQYGAVAVHKSGEIFYITYVADYFN